MRKTNGFDYFGDFIFNSGGSLNPFDSRGHFLRAYLPLNSCVDYELIQESNCGGFFDTTVSGGAVTKGLERALKQMERRLLGETRRDDERDGRGDGPDNGGLEADADGDKPEQSDEETEPEIQIDPGLTLPPPEEPTDGEPQIEVTPGGAGTTTTPEEQVAPAQRMRAARQLMDFLIGDRR